MNWAWYAVGATAAICFGIAQAQARHRYRRWVRRHSYTATIEIYEGDQR